MWKGVGGLGRWPWSPGRLARFRTVQQVPELKSKG